MAKAALRTDELEYPLTVDNTAPPAPKAVEKKKLEPLKFNAMPVSGFDYAQFSIHPEIGVTVEDLQKSEYWVHVMGRLHIGTEIRALAKDMSYRAELIVTYTDGKNVRVKCFRNDKLDTVKPKVDLHQKKQYELKLRGPNKWCIQRLSDGAFIKEFIPTKNEAVVYLDKYLAMLDGDDQAKEYLSALEY